ncbi:late histone H2B.L4 [Tupaia chinensis]|uniref:Histone H2B 3 n=1 Tax=Tupaia chinensis TaxID=246437 RepID=L8YDK3_TUPCH|nr:late histone H2B.L4 [Tupaia chinensis]ELV13030.1 Histone H2B 3 [Tupaia chinensis]
MSSEVGFSPKEAQKASSTTQKQRHCSRRCGPRSMRCPRKNSFAPYFPRVLSQFHRGLRLTPQSVSILDSFVHDFLQRIAEEAASLARYNKSSAITSREIQTAVRLILHGELCKHAVFEGTKALIRYTLSA